MMSELLPYLESVAREIDYMIDRYFVDKVGDLNKASAHLLSAGGKRLRPGSSHAGCRCSKTGKFCRISFKAALALGAARIPSH